MIPLLTKEIREHAKWAALWLAGYALTITYIIVDMSVHRPAGHPLLSPDFQIVTIIGSAAAGLLLGVLQSVSEARRDRWGFLVHRPVTRTALFFGKVLGGLALYLLALLVPPLAAALYLATPGSMAAPSDSRALLPALVDVLGGIAYYFAGLLIGLRPVRWIGSRALPLGAAILCTAGAIDVQAWGLAVLFHALGIAVLGLAAWGSFVAGGEYRPQPRLARAALSLAVLCGVGLAVGGAVFALVAALHRPAESWRSHYVLPDGRIVWVTGDSTARVQEITDVETGRPVARELHVDTYGRLKHHLNPALLTGQSWSGGYRDVQRYAILLPSDYAIELWYFVPRLGRIEIYDRKARRHLGNLYPGGFVPPETGPGPSFPHTAPLSIGWGDLLYLAFEDGVYTLQPREHAATLFHPGPIHGIGTPEPHAAGPEQRSTVIALADRIEFYDPGASEPRFSTPYHLNPQRYPEILVYGTTPAGEYLVNYSSTHDVPRALHDNWIVTIDASGRERRRLQVPQLPSLDVPAWREAAVIGLAPPLLLAVPAGLGVWLNLHHDTGQAFTLAALTELFDTVPDSTVVLVLGVTLVSALASAAVTLWLVRRYDFTRRQCVGWTLWSLLLGPAGLLTLLAVQEWPSRECCPSCGVANVVLRTRCRACDAALQTLSPPDPAAVFD